MGLDGLVMLQPAQHRKIGCLPEGQKCCKLTGPRKNFSHLHTHCCLPQVPVCPGRTEAPPRSLDPGTRPGQRCTPQLVKLCCLGPFQEHLQCQPKRGTEIRDLCKEYSYCIINTRLWCFLLMRSNKQPHAAICNPMLPHVVPSGPMQPHATFVWPRWYCRPEACSTRSAAARNCSTGCWLRPPACAMNEA